MNSIVYQMLAELKLLQLDEQFVFTREDGRRLSSNTYTEQVFRPACKRADVPEVRFHDLRHMFAAYYMMNRGDIYDLQRLMGHSDIQTTQKYLRFAPQYAEQLRRNANTVQIGGQQASPIVTHLFKTGGK